MLPLLVRALRCACSVCRVCAVYAHCVSIVCALCVHCVFIVCALCVHLACTSSASRLHLVCTSHAYRLHLVCISPAPRLQVRLPSLRVATLLLSLMCAYDIFMVRLSLGTSASAPTPTACLA